MQHSDFENWVTLVASLDPHDQSYTGPTEEGVILSKDATYEFDILVYEGDIVTESDNDDRQILPKEPGRTITTRWFDYDTYDTR